MNFKERNDYKSDFKKELDNFADKLEKYVSTDNGDWTVKGFITFTKTSIRFLLTPKSFQKSLKYTSSRKSYSLQTASVTKLFLPKNKTGILI